MTGELTFVDTNVLVYLFNNSAPAKQKVARALLQERGSDLVLSTQVLQEFFVAVTRKLGAPLSADAAERALRDLSTFDTVAVDVPLIMQAVSRVRRDRLSLWDALIVEAARARGCQRLLSEDLQDGHDFGGVVVENPFH
jgi:predicted nucleic acid-binding protein